MSAGVCMSALNSGSMAGQASPTGEILSGDRTPDTSPENPNYLAQTPKVSRPPIPESQPEQSHGLSKIREDNLKIPSGESASTERAATASNVGAKLAAFERAYRGGKYDPRTPDSVTNLGQWHDYLSQVVDSTEHGDPHHHHAERLLDEVQWE